jgi:hypothetical protein
VPSSLARDEDGDCIEALGSGRGFALKPSDDERAPARPSGTFDRP